MDNKRGGSAAPVFDSRGSRFDVLGSTVEDSVTTSVPDQPPMVSSLSSFPPPSMAKSRQTPGISSVSQVFGASQPSVSSQSLPVISPFMFSTPAPLTVGPLAHASSTSAPSSKRSKSSSSCPRQVHSSVDPLVVSTAPLSRSVGKRGPDTNPSATLLLPNLSRVVFSALPPPPPDPDPAGDRLSPLVCEFGSTGVDSSSLPVHVAAESVDVSVGVSSPVEEASPMHLS